MFDFEGAFIAYCFHVKFSQVIVELKEEFTPRLEREMLSPVVGVLRKDEFPAIERSALQLPVGLVTDILKKSGVEFVALFIKVFGSKFPNETL